MNKIDIKLPDGIDEAIDKGIKIGIKEKKKKASRRIKKVVGGVAAGIVIVSGTLLANPALASKIPIVGGAFEAIQDKLIFSGDYSKYATGVNETVTNNGVGVTLSEVLCDGKSLYVSFKIESEKPFKYTKYKYDPKKDYDISKEVAEKIVGVQILDNSTRNVSFSNKELGNSGVAGFEGRYIDENTFIGVEKYDLTDLGDIPNEFDYEIKIKELIGISWNGKDKDQVFRGKWNFKIPVKVDKSLVKEIEVNHKENGFGIKKISITPFETIIETIHGKNRKSLDYNVRVKDEKGNQIDLDSAKWGKESMVNTFINKKVTPKKLTVEIYEDILKSKGNGVFEDVGDKVLYTKDIEIK